MGEVGNAISKLPDVNITTDLFTSIHAEQRRLFSNYTYKSAFYPSEFRLESLVLPQNLWVYNAKQAHRVPTLF